MNLDTSVTLISDGRFSGTNKGGAVGHISPEAMAGGPIAVVQNGDRIEMDIRERRLDLVVPEEEIKRRLKAWRPPQRIFKKGFLARISKTMLPIEKGAILQRDF
jgi:dihydroxy-acid dehydratase